MILSSFPGRGIAMTSLAIAALLVFTPASGAVPPAKDAAVAIKGFAFVPQVITIAPGTTVIWTNTDDDPHTVTATGKSFHSAAMDTQDKFSYTFVKPGDYDYFCSLHPHMTGKVVVKGR